MSSKRKEFSILKWIVFPANSIVLAAIIAYFNITVFGLRDGLPYSIIVGMIGLFSIVIVKYAESDNRSLARAAFVFEIILTCALVVNACYSVSVQRKMSIAKMAETNQKDTIGEISKLRGSRTQREALKKIDKQETAQTVFTGVENILFWIMAAELALYGLSAFTLFALAKLLDGDGSRAREVNDWPDEVDVDVVQDHRSGRRLSQTRKSDRLRQSLLSGDSFDRKKARRKLLEHLRVISHYCPGRWFKADLIEGGVHIRMCARVNFTEQTIADTRQSDRLLLAVDRPDFLRRLVDELIRQGFPIDKAGE